MNRKRVDCRKPLYRMSSPVLPQLPTDPPRTDPFNLQASARLLGALLPVSHPNTRSFNQSRSTDRFSVSSNSRRRIKFESKVILKLRTIVLELWMRKKYMKHIHAIFILQGHVFVPPVPTALSFSVLIKDLKWNALQLLFVSISQQLYCRLCQAIMHWISFSLIIYLVDNSLNDATSHRKTENG